MRKNMLDAIREVNPQAAEDLQKTNANYFMLQNYINQHNAKVKGELPPQQQYGVMGNAQPQLVPGNFGMGVAPQQFAGQNPNFNNFQ